MKDLPPVLRNPENDEYTVEQALQIWLHIYYGYEYDTPKSARAREFYTARNAARDEIKALVQTEEVPNGVRGVGVKPRYEIKHSPRPHKYIGEDFYRKLPPKVTKTLAGTCERQWVTRDDLAALAAEKGVHGVFDEKKREIRPEREINRGRIIQFKQPTRRDDWTNAIIESITLYKNKHQFTANETQLWTWMIHNPPPGYSIQWDSNKKRFTMGDNE